MGTFFNYKNWGACLIGDRNELKNYAGSQEDNANGGWGKCSDNYCPYR